MSEWVKHENINKNLSKLTWKPLFTATKSNLLDKEKRRRNQKTQREAERHEQGRRDMKTEGEKERKNMRDILLH